MLKCKVIGDEDRVSASSMSSIVKSSFDLNSGSFFPQINSASVIDGPGGGGKIPVGPNYILSQAKGKYVLRN